MAESARLPRVGLCLLCGLPAAGKTTAARALSQSLKRRRGWRCALLSYDDLIPLEAFRQLEDASSSIPNWRGYRQELLLYIEHFLQHLMKGSSFSPPPNRTEATWEHFATCLKEQELISPEGSASHQFMIHITPLRPIYFILDDNFYYRSMRYEVYQLARQYTLGFCQLFLDCQVEVCLERNSQRTEPLPEETIYTMGQKIEVPCPEKYTWEQNSLILKSTEDGFEDNLQVINLLSSALENPVKPLEDNTELKEMDRAICAASLLHQADKAVRRIVSQTMKSAKEKNFNPHKMKKLAEELNKQKVEFMEELRQKFHEKNLCCLQNEEFELKVLSVFNQRVEDIFKKYVT